MNENCPQSVVSSANAKTRVRNRYVFLAVLALAGLSASWLASGPGALPKGNSGLVVDEKNLDFGDVWENLAFLWKVVINNPTSEDITILGFHCECSCAAIEPDSLTIPKGGTAQITAKLNLSAAFSKDPFLPKRAQDLGPKRTFSTRFAPVIAAGIPLQKGWQIKGLVERLLTVSPRELNLLDGYVRGHLFPKAKIRVVANCQLEGIVAECPAIFGQVFANRVGASQWDLEIELDPALSVGPFKFNITIDPVGQDIHNLPRTVIPVEGQVTNDIQTSPPRVHFGARALGDISEENVIVFSLAKQPFKILGHRIEAGDLEVEALTDTKSSLTQSFLFRQRIAQAGSRDGKVVFRVDRGDNGEFELSVNTRYHGIVPAMILPNPAEPGNSFGR